MSSPPALPMAEIHWKGSPEDHRALAEREDWSSLEGLEQLWPQLDQRHGEAIALDAPHARPPERFSYRQLRQGIETAAAGFAALGVAARGCGGPVRRERPPLAGGGSGADAGRCRRCGAGQWRP